MIADLSVSLFVRLFLLNKWRCLPRLNVVFMNGFGWLWIVVSHRFAFQCDG